ncbi:hypothetical protein [Streptomyces macrosporus]|uniref:Nucleotide exchange factor GrpE n=1 Tax=Streptomyces macrosporus TaxID=44032 RepID=A0ABN3JHR5_9ACTN
MTEWPSRLRAEWRQRRHHRAFRVEPPWDDAALAEVERLVAEFSAPAFSAPAAPHAADAAPRPERGEPTPDGPAPDRPAPDEKAPDEKTLDEKALAEAATNLWRARRRLAQDGEAPSARSRQTGRYLRACADALANAGVVVQDHDGDPHHPGRSVEVLVFQDDPDLTTETVLQTVRPSVYLGDRRIQMGQVIVGCPVTPADAPPHPDPASDEQVRNDHA